MIVDAHTHIFSLDFQRYPLADPQASYRPTADGAVELLRRQMDDAGVERAVTIPPAWRSPDVLRLASTIYEDRVFGVMPILGDALEDAGCDNADMLIHCRSQAEHVRGCWVVDALLGKV